MVDPRPVVRKTKKSSYKPMSKLNEDSLTEMLRMEKPEYSSQVFFFNTASRAKLHTSVNVWFRDHQTAITNIGRQQSKVYNIMCRMKREQRRVKREGYKRKQQELRKDTQRRQLELTQRRVIRQFRKNAAAKMAARGQKSIAASRLHGSGNRPYIAASMLGSGEGLDIMMRIATGLSTRDEEAVREVTRQMSIEDDEDVKSEEEPQASVSVPRHSHSEVETDKTVSEERKLSSHKNATKKRQKNASNASKATPEICPATQPDPKQTGGQTSRKRSSLVSVAPDLRAIPEVVSPCPSIREEEIIPGREHSSSDLVNTDAESPVTEHSSNLLHTDKSVSPSQVTGKETIPHAALERSSSQSKVLEVRKDRPHSPATRTIIDSLNADEPPIKAPPPGAYTDSPLAHTATGTASSTGGSTHKERKFPQHKTHDHKSKLDAPSKNDKPRKSSCDSRSSIVLSNVPEKTERARKSVCFGNAPSREKVMEDAMTFLSSDSGSWTDSGSTSKRAGKTGMAARIRLERKNEARRRAELLDREPLVQYYRSVRGTLQPLLTKPNRRVFTPPSNRVRYQQVKLLREEHLKDVTRRHDIDKFFKEVFSHHDTVGSEVAEPAPEETKSKTAGSGSNLLASMIQRMHQDSLGTHKASRDSADQLSKCQYLRVYHWGDDSRGDETPPDHKVTSWDAAENSLKAGFLALDFSRK